MLQASLPDTTLLREIAAADAFELATTPEGEEADIALFRLPQAASLHPAFPGPLVLTIDLLDMVQTAKKLRLKALTADGLVTTIAGCLADCLATGAPINPELVNAYKTFKRQVTEHRTEADALISFVNNAVIYHTSN